MAKPDLGRRCPSAGLHSVDSSALTHAIQQCTERVDNIVLVVLGERRIDGQAENSFVYGITRWKVAVTNFDVRAYRMVVDRNIMDLHSNSGSVEPIIDLSTLRNENRKEMITV